MKTPMQMLIEIITPENFLLEEWTAAMIIKDKAIALLEEEKRQIIGAYVQGRMEGHDLPYGMAYLPKLNSSEQEAEQYYNQTYNK